MATFCAGRQLAGVSVQSGGENQRLVPGVTVKDKLVVSTLLQCSCHCGMLQQQQQTPQILKTDHYWQQLFVTEVHSHLSVNWCERRLQVKAAF